MKFKTFEGLLNTCKNLYDTAVEKDKQIQDVFGGDTCIMTDWWDKSITETLNLISEEFGRDPEKDDIINWLFWDSMCGYDMNKGYMNFEVDGIDYIGSPKNVYLDLTGMLDEKLGDIVHQDICEDEDKDEEITLTERTITAEPRKYDVEKIDKETLVNIHNKVSEEKVLELTSEDESNTRTRKLLLLKDKQISLESKELSNTLSDSLDDELNDDTSSIGGFIISLDKQYKALLLDVKHKETLIKMKNQLKMVLLQFAGEQTNGKLIQMIKFEVEKTLNNLKTMNNIFDYSVYEPTVKDGVTRIEGVWSWEDINERTKSFGIEIDEGVEIGFK